jgi:hypothetical protein
MKRRINSPRLLSHLLSAFTLAALLCAAHITPAAAQSTGTQNPAAQNTPAQNTGSTGTNPNTNTQPVGANTTGAGLAQPPAPVQSGCKISTAMVTQVRPHGKTGEVRLGDVIEVDVTGYQTLVDQAQCLPPKKNIVLYLDDRPVVGGMAYPPSNPQPKGTSEVTTLFFTLEPSYTQETGARNVWTHVLGRPSLSEPRDVKVSVGIEDRYAVEATNNTIKLRVVPLNWFGFWLLIFFVLIVGFWLLAKKTDLLRDAVPPPGGGERRPYSLARTQAAWWFFLVLAAYLLIGIITGDFSTTITGTALGLLGISAGTTLGSAFVDAGKAQSPETQAQEAKAITTLDTEIPQLESDVARLEGEVNSPPTGKTEAEVRLELAQARAALETKKSQLNKMNNVSEHFLRDILSDVNGVSFHRFQMMAWSLVLGVIFIVQVYQVLAMPTFNSTLLALLGISAGTFVGLKIPEPTDPTVKK